jgi:hypothetical protein
MKRRAAILSLAAIPFASLAQPRDRQVKIGFLYFASRKSAIDSRRYPQFVKGMADLGYIEGKNLVIEARFADGKPEQLPAQALIILGDTYFLSEVRRLANLALKNRLPSAHTIRDYAEAGGLISYGTDIADNFRRAASYVDKVLKGAKPGDLPIERPTRFQLTINLKTARALGVTIPKAMQFQADKVIE